MISRSDVLTRLYDWQSKNPIRNWRDSKAMSRIDCAAILGVTIATVKSWENGNNAPTPDNFKKLATLMDLEVEEVERIWDEWMESKNLS